MDAAFGGRDWWLHSDLPRWARGVGAGLREDGGGESLAILHATVLRMTTLGFWNWARFALADLAEVAATTGDSRAGEEADRLVAADPWRANIESQLALRQFTEGAAALSRDDPAAAARLLGPAADSFAAAGWGLFEGRALSLLGRALVPSDRTRAVQSLQEAVDRFVGCGAVVRRDRALAILGRLGTKGRRTRAAVAGPGSLTPRSARSPDWLPWAARPRRWRSSCSSGSGRWRPTSPTPTPSSGSPRRSSWSAWQPSSSFDPRVPYRESVPARRSAPTGFGTFRRVSTA